jgi:hypothetical protein
VTLRPRSQATAPQAIRTKPTAKSATARSRPSASYDAHSATRPKAIPEREESDARAAVRSSADQGGQRLDESSLFGNETPGGIRKPVSARNEARRGSDVSHDRRRSAAGRQSFGDGEPGRCPAAGTSSKTRSGFAESLPPPASATGAVLGIFPDHVEAVPAKKGARVPRPGRRRGRRDDENRPGPIAATVAEAARRVASGRFPERGCHAARATGLAVTSLKGR